MIAVVSHCISTQQLKYDLDILTAINGQLEDCTHLELQRRVLHEEIHRSKDIIQKLQRLSDIRHVLESISSYPPYEGGHAESIK